MEVQRTLLVNDLGLLIQVPLVLLVNLDPVVDMHRLVRHRLPRFTMLNQHDAD